MKKHIKIAPAGARITPVMLALSAVFPMMSAAHANAVGNKEEAPFDAIVTINGERPSSLPHEIPTTIESIDAKTLQNTVNAIDAEDALKYLPSLLVRKRYVGDYNHAVLATRASGTGNSARSLVYADGMLLSNLLGNGATFTPRWGLVTPEEIERVEVLYGPFSAAYSGNSVGAVVDYVTRMPTQFEAHAKLTGFTENFQAYGTNQRYNGHQISASLGNRQGNFSWWINANELSSDGHPIVFTNKLLSSGVVSNAGTPVSGAILDKNPQNLPWWLLGASGQYNTVQDHAKIKLAYDFSPSMRLSYTLGYWHNDMNSTMQTYLRDPAGNPVYSGDVNIGGRKYTLTASDFSNSINQLQHTAQGLNLKTFTKGVFDWEIAASRYDYNTDIARAPTVAMPAASTGGSGRITDASGTGWNTLALKAVWRPVDAHTAEFGIQREAYQLRTRVMNTDNWISGTQQTRYSAFQGDTQLQSLYAQDAWRINRDWKAILGLRYENWKADNGSLSNASSSFPFGTRNENYTSPKAAVSWRASEDWMLKASVGRAVRMPTVSELYQGSTSPTAIVNNDPNLKPEKSWTSEWTAERNLQDGRGLLRLTWFHERTSDALYSQVNTLVTPNVTNIQNIDTIRTRGLEIAWQNSDVGLRGLDVNASLTYTDSTILRNDKFPASTGKQQPRVPAWRANLLLSYRASDKLSTALGIRYSGRQYGTLDNSDPNEFAYSGFSSFVVADIRMRYQVAKQWSVALGIDNLSNEKYWAYHPYTQRSLIGELKFDY